MSDYVVTAYGAAGDGVTDDTGALQRAVDACAGDGGGRVVIPAGAVCLTGAFALKSNVELHIEGGGRLAASKDPMAFIERPRGFFWIHAEEASNIAITGQGLIDGRAKEFMNEEQPYAFVGARRRPRAIGLFGCTHVRIRDLTIQETADWAIHPCGCEDVVIHGVTIRNNLKVPNCDGIDPDRCRNVRISDCHIESGDDGIVIKCRDEWKQYGSCENITITGCTIISTSCGIKIGTETFDDIRNVTVSACVVYDSNRGLGVCHRDQGTVENIIFSNCVVRTRLFHDKWWGKAEPIYVTALPRTHETRPGPLRNIRFANIQCRSENGVYIQGTESNRPSNIALSGVDLTIAKYSRWPGGRYDPRPCPPEIVPRDGALIGEITPWGALVRRTTPGVYIESADQVTVCDSRVRWSGALPDSYTHGLEANDAPELRLERFNACGAHPDRDMSVVIDGKEHKA